MVALKRRYTAGDTVVAIINPNTRIDSMQVRAALGQWIPEGVNLRIFETKRGVPTVELAREVIAGADGVIASGGDGTVSEVAATLSDTDIPLGIIPSGSTNIIAQELGIPQSIPAAAALAFGPFDIRLMDVAHCNGMHFLHMGGTGLDSLTFEATDEALKRRVGWLAYIPAAIRALREKSVAFRITIDEEELAFTSPLILVANGSAVVSPAFRLDESIRSDDGLLDAIIVTANRPHEMAMLLAHAANPLATLTDSPYVVGRKARRILIESDEPQPIQLDGDVVTHTPAEFTISPAAINICIPSPRRHR